MDEEQALFPVLVPTRVWKKIKLEDRPVYAIQNVKLDTVVWDPSVGNLALQILETMEPSAANPMNMEEELEEYLINDLVQTGILPIGMMAHLAGWTPMEEEQVMTFFSKME